MAANLKGLLPRHHSELLLSFDEYVETWSELIGAGCGSIMTDEKVFSALDLDRNDARLSVEIALALCYDAMRTWRRSRRVPDKVKVSLEAAVVAETGRRMLGEEIMHSFVSLYHAHCTVFSQLMPEEGTVDKGGELRELAGVARYVASRCSRRGEEQNIEGIQLLAVHFARTHRLFCRLNENSIPDGNTMLFKKPRFIVRADT
ncbi:MAG TPA: hypothetical protein PK071_04590 [Atopobiaceae bacterium]|nr:hypothetical protein [Atopobiaceae bacterium]